MTNTIEVRVPDIGDFHDIPIVEVRVRPGDTLRPDDAVVVLESEKAAMDVPSPVGGIVRAVLAKAGDKVSEGSPLVTLEISDETPQRKSQPEEAPVPKPQGTTTVVPTGVRTVPPKPGPTKSNPLPLASGIIPDEPASLPVSAGPRRSPTESIPLVLDQGKVEHHASPAVRRLARELGVDLGRIRGTGRHGRIVEEDLRHYIKEALAHPPVAEPSGFQLPEIPAIDFSKFGPIESKPLGRVRLATAKHMHRAWLRVPHVTQHEEADITDLDAFRRAQADEAKRRGVRLTLLAFVMKAVAATLKEHGTFNASLDPSGEKLILKRYIHLGIAVDTPEGLLVPVVRDVDRKSVWELAATLEAVSKRAREQKLTLEDLQGGSFTISSLGGIGGTGFSPIVNAPEVAILGLSRADLQPVYRDGQLLPRLILPFSLSYDHRANDGAQAARFTSHLRALLSDIRQVLL